MHSGNPASLINTVFGAVAAAAGSWQRYPDRQEFVWYDCTSDPLFPYKGMVLVACREDFVKPMGNPPEPLHLAEKGMLKVMDSDALSTYLFPSLGGVRIPYQVVVRTRF